MVFVVRCADDFEEADEWPTKHTAQSICIRRFQPGAPSLAGVFAVAFVLLTPVAYWASGSFAHAIGSDAPAMEYIPQIIQSASKTHPTMTKMMGTASERNSNTWLQDYGFSKVPDKELTSGLFLMNKGSSLQYTYTYEEFRLIIDGEFHLTDGTGQKVVAKQGDMMYFPKASRINFDTPDTALGYFCGQRKGGDSVSGMDDLESGRGPMMQHFPQILTEPLAKMNASNTEVNSKTWLSDFGFSTVPGKEMTTGLFRMDAGDDLEYAYDLEELNFIVEGEFSLRDGTGQTIYAKKGDLVHIPNGTDMTFDTPNTGLGFFCGQRKGRAGPPLKMLRHAV